MNSVVVSQVEVHIMSVWDCLFQFEMRSRWKSGKNSKNWEENFLCWTSFFTATQFITLATLHNAIKCTSYFFWYKIPFQWKIVVNHCIWKRKSVLGPCPLTPLSWAEWGRETKVLLASWFMLVMPTDMILIYWVACMLLHKAKTVTSKIL